jgi:hypothetical protein
MAFQPVNYAGIAPMGISGIGQGMKMGMMPFQEIRKAKSDQLANALNQLKLEYLPQEYQSQFALRAAQAQKAQQDAAKQKMLSEHLKKRLEGAGNDELGEILFRKLVGLPEETPSEKQRRELSTYKQKKQFEQELSGGETTGFKTQKQVASQGIENTLPLLDELQGLDVPGQGAAYIFSPDKQAKYQSVVSGITDSLVGALGLPKSNESLKTVEKMIARQPRESDKAYRRRLLSVGSDLMSRYKKLTGKDLDFEFSHQLEVPIIAPNGKRYMVPANKVDDALKAGGRRG